MPATLYAVLTRTAYHPDAWIDCWEDDDGVNPVQPVRFTSWREAESAIREHLDDCEAAGLDYARADFRVQPIQAGEGQP